MAGVETVSRILSNPAWDLLIMFFFLAFGFFYGISAGTRRLLALLFATYIGILLFENFSYLNFFTQERSLLEVFVFRAIAFLTLIALLTFLLNRTIFSQLDKSNKVWRVLALSFLETGLLISAVFQLLPAKELFTFSPVTETLFASTEFFFWWLTLPLISLLWLVKSRKKR